MRDPKGFQSSPGSSNRPEQASGLSDEQIFHFLQTDYTQQQSFYWQRFSAFAALHAGLFVLVTSTALDKTWPVEWFGVVLGLAWILVQWASLHYVDRVKEQYHEVRERLGIHYGAHWLFSRPHFSSTDLALYSTLIVFVVWILVAVGAV